MDRWMLVNASQALAFLCAAGILTCVARLRTSHFPAHLIAFAMMLAGTLLISSTGALYRGIETLDHWPLLLAAVARGMQILGALLFVRAVTVAACGEWVWLGVALAAALFAAAVP